MPPTNDDRQSMRRLSGSTTGGSMGICTSPCADATLPPRRCSLGPAPRGRPVLHWTPRRQPLPRGSSPAAASRACLSPPRTCDSRPRPARHHDHPSLTRFDLSQPVLAPPPPSLTFHVTTSPGWQVRGCMWSSRGVRSVMLRKRKCCLSRVETRPRASPSNRAPTAPLPNPQPRLAFVSGCEG